MQEHVSTQTQKNRAVELIESSALDMPGNKQIPSDFNLPASPVFTNEYVELKRLIKQKGLLDKQPIYYTYKFLFTMGLLAVSLALLIVVHNFWLQLLNAGYLAFVFTQIATLAHDNGHRQIFRTTWKALIFNCVVINVLLGWSWSWWIDRHNRHHAHPNQLDLDPDIDTPFFSLSEENARGKSKFLQFIVKYQAYFFFPLQVLAAIGILIWSIQFLVQKKAKYRLTEAVLIVVHYVMYFGLLLSLLGAWHAVLFIVVHQALLGLYLGSIFAPNHKGMPILDKDCQLDFLRRLQPEM
ncbi:MAG TPA: fatty acid desaturase [Methylomirabilota bacterium]|nr:fatty acid desaturase [Methylomirabilota bacterium]